jgi:hypothetical protein
MAALLAGYHQGMWKVPVAAIVGLFIGAGVAAALEAIGAPEFLLNLVVMIGGIGGAWIGWKLHLKYPPAVRSFFQFGTRGMLMLVVAIAMPAALWRYPMYRAVLLLYWAVMGLIGAWVASIAMFARIIKRSRKPTTTR